MRWLAAAAMALAIAPGAFAQEAGCPLIQGIVAAAPDGFVAQRGEEIDDGLFDAKVWLRDADECAVDLTWGSQFYCVWDADTTAAAQTQVVLLSEAVKLCLPAWPWEDIAGETSENNLEIIKGIAMIGAGDNEDTLIRIYAEAFPDSPQRQVWLEVVQP